MANTESLGFNYRGKAWNDGEKITRVTQPDGSIAEGMASLGYVWDASGSQWVKVPGDALNGIKVQITAGAVGGGPATIADGADVTQGTEADVAYGGSGSGTVVSILKGIYGKLAGTLATSRTWVLSSGTDSVNVGNFPASQTVTGPLTDTQLRASPVPVSGTFFQATQPVSGTVAVSSEPSDAAVGAALPSVVKVIGAYDPNTGTIRAARIQNVNGDDQLLVYDGRVRQEITEMTEIMAEIRDMLRKDA